MYKLYTNKNSLRRAYSRLLQGGTSSTSGDKVSWWERKNIQVPDGSWFSYTITSKTAGRPDTVAYETYGTTELEWVIIQVNNIIDVNEEFVVGKTIKVPTQQYVLSSILTKSVGNI